MAAGTRRRWILPGADGGDAPPSAAGPACGRLLRHLLIAGGADLDRLVRTFPGGAGGLDAAVRRLLIAGYIVVSRDADGSRAYLTRRSRAALRGKF